jgi:ribosomal-protein-alanine N-acetyltransferase
LTKQDIIFETERFRIVKARKEDFADYLEMVSASEIFKFGALMTQKAQDEQKAKETFNAIMIKEKPSTFMIKQENKGLGVLTMSYSEYLKTYELGYIINHNYWHKGIATEVSKCALEYLFNTKKTSYVYAIAVAENSASRRVLEKCGFTLEGILRNNFMLRDELKDDARYGITFKEWEHYNTVS